MSGKLHARLAHGVQNDPRNELHDQFSQILQLWNCLREAAAETYQNETNSHHQRHIKMTALLMEISTPAARGELDGAIRTHVTDFPR